MKPRLKNNDRKPSYKDASPLQGQHLTLPRWVASTIVFTAAVACFSVTRNAAFVFDDAEAILGNKDVDPNSPLGEIFRHDFWGSLLASNTSHKSYRPLTVLTYRWSHWLAGGLNAQSFHIVNILLHAVVCVLLLPVCDLVLQGQVLQGHDLVLRGQGRYSWKVVVSGLLFAVHPVHSESVAGVVGRADLLCAATVLLAFLLYHRHLTTGCEAGVASYLWLASSMLLSLFATLFKEQGVTVLGLILVYDFIIHCEVDPLTALHLRTNQHFKISSLPLARISIVMATALLILIGRWLVMGSAAPTFQVVDNPHSFVDNVFFRILNYHYLYALNTWLLLCPLWLCFDWSMGCVPVIQSLLDPRLLAVLAFWFVSGVLIGSLLMQKPGRRQRSLLVSVSFVVLPFLPASNVLFRVGFVVAERALYLPSAGFVWLVTMGLEVLWKRSKSHIWWMLVTLLLTTHGWRSYQRSCDWLTEEALFESGHRVCPLNAKVQYNIGKVYSDSERIDAAIEKYRLAIRLHPQYDQAMNNLGNLLKDLGELQEAETLLLEATHIRPEFAAAWMNLAIVQASLNQSQNAEHSYHTALRHRRNYPDCYYNLGNLYLAEGRHNQALAAWRNATIQKPEHLSAWSNMIILLDNLGRLSDVLVVGKEALHHNPSDPGIHYNIGNALGKAGNYAEAEGHFLKAVKLRPEQAMYFSNLGVLYHRWGRHDDAEKYYQRALELEPTNQQTRQNYDMLIRKRSKT